MDFMSLRHKTSPLRNGQRKVDIKSIVKRMLTCIRNRVLYHPDQIAETKNQLPSAEGLIGMSSAEFATYLSAQFTKGMSFSNWGPRDSERPTWQIDHMIPLSAYDVRDLQQVIRLSHWTNLQPMWSDANYEKWNIIPQDLTALQQIRFAYMEIPGNFNHLQLRTVPGMNGLVQLPIHDAYTQLRISYAHVDRKRKYNKESDQEIIRFYTRSHA